ARFPRDLLVPGRQRLVYSLVRDGELQADGPDTLTGKIVRNDDNAVVVASISASKRRIDANLNYWDFHTELSDTGIYTLYVDGASADGTS
ncbi:MAG TPA: hypothetical protein PLV68_09955, partial [Ilumatobacteraceae bacterium]|nr:hypothetical protein [Ilumatobacteraceae bacterium]